MQSSITAWLKKPAAVKEPPPSAKPATAPIHASHISTDNNALPTPPPEETRDQAQGNDHVNTTTPLPPSFAVSTKPPPLIANITLEPCTRSNISSFKRLNTLLLPIPYPTKFYDEILSEPVTSSITLLAIWRDTPAPPSQPQDQGKVVGGISADTGRVVGGIRCRLLGSDSLNTGHTGPLLYISTLTVLSPYRHYGIATHLLSAITAVAIEKYQVKAVGAHVWTQNAEGREWYAKRGFKEERVEEGYYRRLKPSGAVVVRRAVGVADLLGK